MKTIKVGIFGLYRGGSLVDNFLANNAEIVAICDSNPKWLNKAKEKLKYAAAYTDFDSFIEHEGMEAVLLTNYFHEHTPYAIRALEKGIHVLSECLSNSTMAEGVALVRAAEKSKATYMLLENYPYMEFNREMHRVFKGGSLGELMFAEGEYNHPGNPDVKDIERYKYLASLKPFATHWRNLLPATYYITHALAPLMYITGATPKKVNAFPITLDYPENEPMSGLYKNDRTAIIMTHNDNSSVFRVTGCATFGFHENSYRICGTKGQMENIRDRSGRVLLNYNEWDTPIGFEHTNTYKPELHDPDQALLEKAGHGGGDFVVIREFLSCIREGRRPQFDVYFATTCASVAILAHRSILNGNATYDIPDFRLPEDRKKYENDKDTPFYGTDGSEPTIRATALPNACNFKKIENYASFVENFLK
ncbi:MAG: Gfo/Idh/MocA family oxidoreductase [Clostridia bacterium]|nr:Gfo/Idh/MocA family oxidoreductase [Clostridia bacterium]